MLHRITVLPEKQNIEVSAGANLLDSLQQSGVFVNAPVAATAAAESGSTLVSRFIDTKIC